VSPLELSDAAAIFGAVCQTEYWGAIFVTAGASDRLAAALAQNGSTALYDRANVMSYVWNQAVYSPVVDPVVSGNLQLLSEVARVAYSTGNGTGNIQAVSGAAISILAKPWELQSINIQPTTQGSRAILNTLVIILILIQEFFYLGTINGLYAQFKLYARLDPHRIVVVRNLNSLAYTFIGSLCVVGSIWAFRYGWDVNGKQFVLSWMTLWLFAHINFLTLDVFTIWLPHPFVPMALIAWVIFNVTSILLPFELSPAFYRLGYIFPAHEVYQILTDIWSHGCNPQLRYALPILFSWELVTLVLSGCGVFRRRHFAILAEELQAKEVKERVDTAMAFETTRKRKESTQLEAEISRVHSEADRKDENYDEDEESARRGLTDLIERVNTRQQREQRMVRTESRFGPAFDLPFNHESDSDE